MKRKGKEVNKLSKDRPRSGGIGRSFYRNQGFSKLGGLEAEKTRAAADALRRAREGVPLNGNLFKPVVTADFPGAPTWLPVNWLLFPDRKFDYCLINLKPGCDWPLHLHGYGEEIYLVISGHGRVTLGDRDYEATQHDVFHIPPGTPHTMVNTSEDQDLCIFAVNAPAVWPELRSEYWAVPIEG